MKYATMIFRYLLGIIYFVFGLNFFLQFIPQPDPTPEAGAFLGALFVTGYMFPIIKVIEIVIGLALLTNRFVPLALVLIAPISINIFLVHLLLDPSGLALGAVILLGNAFLLFAYRNVFTDLLKPQMQMAHEA
jgi:putative oxidoreductase